MFAWYLEVQYNQSKKTKKFLCSFKNSRDNLSGFKSIGGDGASDTPVGMVCLILTVEIVLIHT